MRGWLWVLVAGALGCQDTDECIQLRKIQKKAERTLRQAQGQASIADRTSEKLERLRSDAQSKLARLGLEMKAEEVEAALEKRAQAMPKGKVERDKRAKALDPRERTSSPELETVFRVEYAALDLQTAWRRAEAIIQTPPLTRFLGLYAPKRRRLPWQLELGPAEVERIEMKIDPRPLPTRRNPDDVPEEFGFCGASELRTNIARVEEEIAAIEAKAKSTTVNLPLVASWMGLSRRVDRIVAIETESRRLADLLVNAAVEKEQRLIAVGVEADSVLLEIEGGRRQLGAIQRTLPEDLLQALRELPGQREGVARLAIANGVAASSKLPHVTEHAHGAGSRPARGP